MLRSNPSEFIFKWLFLFLSFDQKHEKEKKNEEEVISSVLNIQNHWKSV